MEYKFYRHPELGYPMIDLHSDYEPLGRFLNHELRRASRAKGVLNAVRRLQSGELRSFSWGGDAAFAELNPDNKIEITPEAYCPVDLVEMEIEDFEKILSDWLAFLEEHEEIENAKPDRLSQKMIELHEQRTRDSSDE